MASRTSGPVNVQNINTDTVHAPHASKPFTPLCPQGARQAKNGDASFANTTDAVDCGSCTKIQEKQKSDRERLEYNTNVAASQEPGSQHLHPMEDARPVAPAVEPVKDSEGETVTIPVDFDDPSKGRRELDASQGERVISEDTYTVRATPTAVQLMDDTNEDETPETWTPSFSEAKNEPYEGPESIPAVPEGVSENVWFMAHYADTESARGWWMRKAESLMVTSEPTEDAPPF